MKEICLKGDRKVLEEVEKLLFNNGFRTQKPKLKGNYLRIKGNDVWYSDNDIYCDYTFELKK